MATASSRMLRAVGRSVSRKDGIGKATGAARYADDLTFPGLLHARTIRTTIPAGQLTGIRLDFDLTGFTVVDHRDIPGRNAVVLVTPRGRSLPAFTFAIAEGTSTTPNGTWPPSTSADTGPLPL